MGRVTAVSIADDWRGVAPGVRLSCRRSPRRPSRLRCTAAIGRRIFARGRNPIVLAAFAIVWSANLFNFMDGSDGWQR
jgi:hypothetical protein